MQLPLQNTLSLLQTKWKSIIDPVLANPTTNMSILKNVVLASGNNQIPHLLGKMQQGWVSLDINAAQTVFRYKAFNDTYLYLTASGAMTVTLGVF
jgi:hypothetical protein